MEERIRADLKQAQLMANELIVATLRLLLSEIRNSQIAKGSRLTDDEIIQVIQKELKKRKESSEAFKKADREELVEREEAESAILRAYLPEQLSDQELTKIVEQVINETGAKGINEMGKVIGTVRARVGLKAEGERISKLVRQRLS